jgi:hypothetical protein
MKKSFTLLLSMLFVLGFAVSAFAIHAEIPAETQAVVAKGTTQISLGGSLRYRGDYRNNTDFNDDTADNRASYDGRVRLTVDASVSPNTMGRIHLQSSGGDNDLADGYGWGQTSAGAGTAGFVGGDGQRGDLRILEAWVQSKELLGTPISLKIGHMPLALGARGLFFEHRLFGDDAIILFTQPSPELEINVLAIKLNEGLTTQSSSTGTAVTAGSTSGTLPTGSDDSDAYVALFHYRADNVHVGGDITYVQDQDASSDGLNLWNFGLRGDVSLEMVDVYGDVEIQTGELEGVSGLGANVLSDASTGDNNIDISGLAFIVGAMANLDMVSLNLEFGYGSGDDNATDNETNVFMTAMHPSAKEGYTYVYDYRAATAAVYKPNAGITSGNTNTGIANTTYVKLGASAKPMPDLTAALNLFYLKASEEISSSSNSVFTTAEDDIGFEIDGYLKYQLDKNLVYFVEAGILIAGDMYKVLTDSNEDPDNPVIVRHGVEMTF